MAFVRSLEDIERDRQALKREEVVYRLLPVVEGLLKEGDSYSALKVEQIIGRAGMARSTFYRYFDDKAALLLALSEPALADVVMAARGPWELGPDATREDLEQAMRATIAVYQPHIALLNAMIELSAYNPAVGDRYLAGFEVARAFIADKIRDGQTGGYMRADLIPDETAAWLTWMAERGMARLIPNADSQQIDRLVAAFTSLLWHAVYVGG